MIIYNIMILPRANIIGRIAPRAKNYYTYYIATPIILYAIILYRRLY